MRGAWRRTWPSTAVVVVCVSALFASGSGVHRLNVASTHAVHSARLANRVDSFGGASFVPSDAPVVTASLRSTAAQLTWDRVATSAGVDATYRVMRTDASGSIEVCTGSNVPVVSGSTVSCEDPTIVADVPYTFTEQPVLVRNATTTWSRPPSAQSAQVVGPRVAFANVGATVTSTGAAVTVPYPNGTRLGDVLVLISISGRQNAPNTPAGWTVLASVGNTGGSPMRLFVAWRLADAATSLAFDPNANGTGASVRIVRYVRGNGNTSAPVLATAQVATSTGAQSVTFTPTVDVSTNATNSQVVNVVAVRGTATLTISNSQGFVVDDAYPGTVGPSLGLGGRQALISAAVASPTWSSNLAATWASATLAFR